jgi:hypothetical protein
MGRVVEGGKKASRRAGENWIAGHLLRPPLARPSGLDVPLAFSRCVRKLQTFVGDQNGQRTISVSTTQSCPQLVSGLARLEINGSWCIPVR